MEKSRTTAASSAQATDKQRNAMNDRELIARILRGDHRLFANIVEAHSGKVFSQVLGLVKREDMAQEITQQTFVRVYMRLGDWRGERLGAWIMPIAMHLALNAIDKERRRRTEELGDQPLRQDEYSEEHEQLLQRLEEAIDGLPANDRAIVRLHYYEKMKAEDVAAKLGMTKSNVLVRLHRIREQLKKKIGNGNDE